MSDPGRDIDDAATPDPGPGGDLSEREAAFTRRALLQAGWTAPVVLAAALPQTAAAQTGHTDTHTDTHTDAHIDVLHSDLHTDSAHVDTPLDTVPHVDVPHGDNFSDVAHTDTHTDAHTDAHTDT
jgi:hypothetical protein